MNERPLRSARRAASDSDPDGDVVLDGRGRLALYLAVGLVAGAVIALQIGIMRVFSVGSWAHFGSLVVSLAMLGFGLTSAVMCVAKDWFRAPLARRRQRRARCCSGRSPSPPICSSSSSASTRSSSSPTRAQKWRLLANFLLYLLPFLAGAVFLGMRVPQEQSHVRPRLFRRSRRLGPLRPRRSSAAMYLLRAGGPDRRAAGALARRPGSPGPRGPGGRRIARAADRRSPCSRSAAISSPRRPRHQPARGQRLQGRRLRAQFPRRRSASTRASRPSATSRSTPAPICTSRPASPTTPRSICRRCRPTPISACISTATGRSASSATCRPRRPPISASCRCIYPYVIKTDAQDLRRAVRRRHLDRGGAALGRQQRHGRRGQPGGARRLPHDQVIARLHRRHPHDPRSASSTTTGRLYPRPHRRALRRRRSEPRRLGRPLQPRRLRDRREVSPTRARRW